MEWLAFVVGGGTASYVVWWLRERRTTRRLRARELDQTRRLAEEDVIVLGEQLRRLAQVAGDRELDRAAEDAYHDALDAYERARREAHRLHDLLDLDELMDTLAGGRYAIACVRAALDGLDAPPRLTSCFFNPQHGPSATQVLWTPTGWGTRLVPACRQCASRVASHERPAVRMVRVGDHQLPYWQLAAARRTDGYCWLTPSQSTGPWVSWVADTAIAGDWDLGHWDLSRRRR